MPIELSRKLKLSSGRTRCVTKLSQNLCPCQHGKESHYRLHVARFTILTPRPNPLQLPELLVLDRVASPETKVAKLKTPLDTWLQTSLLSEDFPETSL